MKAQPRPTHAAAAPRTFDGLLHHARLGRRLLHVLRRAPGRTVSLRLARPPAHARQERRAFSSHAELLSWNRPSTTMRFSSSDSPRRLLMAAA